ncbi:MAG: hypothetical protein IJX89_04190 [Alphaproteobacteria bacterium]|nr:hypothetical protein [Alphaproteobacteria bacterium]
MKKILLAVVAILVANSAMGVTFYDDGDSGKTVVTKIDCSTYNSLASGYVSGYNSEVGTNTLANDWAYFKEAYCGTLTSVQTQTCYKWDFGGVAKGKIVVADCVAGSQAKIYFPINGGTISDGTDTSVADGVPAYISFAATCDQCSGTTTGAWTTAGDGYQVKTTTTTSSDFCNICKTTTSSTFRCASGYYGSTTQDSPTGCTKCTTATSVAGTSTPGSNTSASSCSFKCASGYYGTATSATAGCKACPQYATCAGGNGSTFSCNSGYFSPGTAYGCVSCPDNANECSGTGFVCTAGYYAATSGAPFMNVCNLCPGYVFNATQTNLGGGGSYTVSGTTAVGATSITECYMPADGYYGTADDTGFWLWNSDCYYAN